MRASPAIAIKALALRNDAATSSRAPEWPGPRCPVYVLIEIDMELVLVDLEPQTFDVKLDREFLY